MKAYMDFLPAQSIFMFPKVTDISEGCISSIIQMAISLCLKLLWVTNRTLSCPHQVCLKIFPIFQMAISYFHQIQSFLILVNVWANINIKNFRFINTRKILCKVTLFNLIWPLSFKASPLVLYFVLNLFIPSVFLQN